MKPQINANKDDKLDKIEKKEISDAIFNIQSDNFSSTESTPQLNSDIAADLEQQLTRSSEPFSTVKISIIKKLFYDLGLPNVTTDQVRNFLDRLPKIEHIDYHKHTFEILQFLCENTEFAKLIYSSQVLYHIDYSTFETVDDQIKTLVSDMVLKIVEAQPELINSFVSNFFPYFYKNMHSPNFYANEGLSTHLQLASKFICAIEDQNQIEYIFSRFMLFMNHTNSDVISQSFYGLVVSIKKHQFLLHDPEFSTRRFIERLIFIGTHRIKSTGPLVFIVLEYLLASNFKYTDDLYETINNLIIFYLDPSTSLKEEEEDSMNSDEIDQDRLYNRDDALSLLHFAFANESFIKTLCLGENEDGLDNLMRCFLESYSSFKLVEKVEAAYCFANFFGYLPLSIIPRYASNEVFFDCLIDMFEFENEKILQALLNGLNRPLKTIKDLFTAEQKTILADSLETITYFKNTQLARTAQVVLKSLDE